MRNFFWLVLAGMGLLAILVGAAGPAHAQSATSILTQTDGLAGSSCNPEFGSNSNNITNNSGCCGAPGLRACSVVLNAGKGTLGLSAGCTNPDQNILRIDPFYYINPLGSYGDSDPTQCALPWPPVPENANLLPPGRPQNGRNFTFYVASDVHYWRTGIDFTTSVNLPKVINQFAFNTPPWPADDPVNSMSTNPQHGFQPPVAIVMPGDLTTDAVSQRMGAFRLIWERNWIGDSIQYPVYPGFGNHDAANGADWGIANALDGQRRWDYQMYRTLGLHADRNHTGCLVGVSLSCLDEGDLGGSMNYSWDWQGVHFVMLNTWAGDTDRAYSPPLGMDGLTWLKNDLAYYVGSSGRPVILFQHYPLQNRGGKTTSGSVYFPESGYDAFKAIIDPYNVVAALVGHTHMLSGNGGIDLQSGAHVEDIEDGSGGDCGTPGCSGGDASFLVVHMTDTYFEVSAVTYNDTTLPQATVGVDYPAWTNYFPSGLKHSPTCRRMINPIKTQVDPAKVSVTFGNGKAVLHNLTSQAVQGPFLLASDWLYQWDYTDSCGPGNSNYYLSVSDASIAANGSVTVSYNGSPSSMKLYTLSDKFVVDQSAVNLGNTPVSVNFSMLSGGNIGGFTYSVDQPWVNVQPTITSGRATVTFTLSPQASYTNPQATFTLTPGDPSMPPVTVTINLLAPVQINANLPDPPTVQGKLIIADAYVILNGTLYGLPYSGSALVGDPLTLNISMPLVLGKQITFAGWSDNGATQHTVTVPNGGLNLTANFNVAFQVLTSVTPTGGGTLAVSQTGTNNYFPADSDLVFTATPNPGYYFVDYEGSISETTPQYLTSVTKPMNVTARFATLPTLSLSTNIPANESVSVSIGTQSGPPPQSATKYAPGTSVVLTAPQTVASVVTGQQYVFSHWADDNSTSASRTLTVPSTSTNYQAVYTTQYLVSATASPADEGSVTGGGWINAGAQATIQAVPLNGFQLSSFTGSLTGSTNPSTVTVTGPMTITANLAPTGPPRLYAAPAGAASDTTSGRLVPLLLQNTGSGGAVGAAITSISQFRVLSGSGTVTYIGDPKTLAATVSFADIPAAASAQANVLLTWPATATRVQMTVNFTSANGVPGSTVLNLFR